MSPYKTSTMVNKHGLFITVYWFKKSSKPLYTFPPGTFGTIVLGVDLDRSDGRRSTEGPVRSLQKETLLYVNLILGTRPFSGTLRLFNIVKMDVILLI